MMKHKFFNFTRRHKAITVIAAIFTAILVWVSYFALAVLLFTPTQDATSTTHTPSKSTHSRTIIDSSPLQSNTDQYHAYAQNMTHTWDQFLSQKPIEGDTTTKLNDFLRQGQTSPEFDKADQELNDAIHEALADNTKLTGAQLKEKKAHLDRVWQTYEKKAWFSATNLYYIAYPAYTAGDTRLVNFIDAHDGYPRECYQLHSLLDNYGRDLDSKNLGQKDFSKLARWNKNFADTKNACLTKMTTEQQISIQDLE
ncbi:hypothetical protein ACFQY8_07725 [Alloscardovia venturai]|uniref:Uncharacterized protein n=1 Tax=Alloscardovia venturai TaxID=1769421 RepID=A0ABW2Y7P7_9BIFI